MSETANVTVPVFTFLLREQQEVYLQRRWNTGYLDGFYEPPAGKLDKKEFPVQAACRETEEESGLFVVESDLELFHTYMNITDGEAWLGLFFRTTRWQGEPTIRETKKCDDAGWFDINSLPRLTPQVADAASVVLTAATISMSNYDRVIGNEGND